MIFNISEVYKVGKYKEDQCSKQISWRASDSAVLTREFRE